MSLSSDTELVKLAAIQDLWLANVRAGAAHGSTGNYQTQPLPHQLSYGHFRITVPPGTPLDTEELVIDLRSRFGVSYVIQLSQEQDGAAESVNNG